MNAPDSTIFIFVYRWACKMENEGIAPNAFRWSSCYGQKVVTVVEYSVLARLDQLYIFGTIPSSSILRAHLYTTPSSMNLASLIFICQGILNLKVDFWISRTIYVGVFQVTLVRNLEYEFEALLELLHHKSHCKNTQVAEKCIRFFVVNVLMKKATVNVVFVQAPANGPDATPDVRTVEISRSIFRWDTIEI